jgi:hypothetical protein
VETLEDRTALSHTITTLSASPNPAAGGQPVTFTAVITGGDFTPGLGSPLGRVTFLDGALPLQTMLVSADPVNHQGVATLTTPVLAAGSHTITAQYSGEIQGQGFPRVIADDASTSNAVTEVVVAPAADVSTQVRVPFGKPRPVVAGRGASRHTLPHRFQVLVTLTNIGATAIQGPLELVLDGAPPQVRLLSPPVAGVTQVHPPLGDPFVRLDVAQLGPGTSASLTLVFKAPRAQAAHVTTRVFAGDGMV